MEKSRPRVPLAATIDLPGVQRTIQVNHCKMPDCSNFGIPARTKHGKTGPSADRDMRYKVHSTNKGTTPAIRCKVCLDMPPIKSNASIVAEVERLAAESGIWSVEESTACHNAECENHAHPIALHPTEYRKRGKPKSGKGQYYECKRCRRRTLVSDPVRLLDGSRRHAVDLLGRIANKSPVRGSIRGSRLKSIPAYYRIVDFLHRRCRAYSGAVDRALIDGRLKLPEDMNIQADAQVYQLNWVSRLDRRNVELSTYSSVHSESRFVLGMHCNFDGRVDPFEINAEAVRNGDLGIPEAFRKHGHYWLAGDELGAGRAMARRDERARVDLLTQIQELYAAAESRKDVENIELQVLDTTFSTPFLSRGLQVHMPYTAYAHWFLLHRILDGAGVKQVQANMDIDSMGRAAFLSAFAEEVKRGDAHLFFVNYTKYQTIDERERILKESKKARAVFRQTLPASVRKDAKEVKPAHDDGPDRGTAEARQMGRRVGHAPAPHPERTAQGHVLADPGPRSGRKAQGGTVLAVGTRADRQRFSEDPASVQRTRAAGRHLERAQQGLARLRAVQPGDAGEVRDDIPGGEQLRVRGGRRQDAGDAAGLREAAPRFRGHRLARAAGAAAETGAAAGEEGGCRVGEPKAISARVPERRLWLG